MADITENQMAIMGLLLIVGLAIGMLLSSGGGQWKKRARELEAQNKKLIADHEAVVKAHEARYAAASQRIGELEKSSGPIGAGTATAIVGGVRGSDDLTKIEGIDGPREVAINEAGYHRYADIAKLSDKDATALEGRLGLAAGTIESENWRGQAKALK